MDPFLSHIHMSSTIPTIENSLLFLVFLFLFRYISQLLFFCSILFPSFLFFFIFFSFHIFSLFSSLFFLFSYFLTLLFFIFSLFIFFPLLFFFVTQLYYKHYTTQSLLNQSIFSCHYKVRTVLFSSFFHVVLIKVYKYIITYIDKYILHNHIFINIFHIIYVL